MYFTFMKGADAVNLVLPDLDNGTLDRNFSGYLHLDIDSLDQYCLATVGPKYLRRHVRALFDLSERYPSCQCLSCLL